MAIDPITGAIIAGIGKVAKDFIGASVQKRQSDNERNVKLAKIAGGTIVGLGGIAALWNVARKNPVTEISTPQGSIKTIGDTSVAQAMVDAGFVPSLESARVDTKSVWRKSLNKGATQFGANMIDNQTGASHHVQYFIKPVGDMEFDVYESVDDGNWERKGHVDQKRMGMNDLSSDVAGGPVFGYLAQLAKNIS